MDIRTSVIWRDGVFLPWDETLDHHLTHSLHYAGAAWEGVRFYDTPEGPKAFRLHDHIARLFFSASVLSITIPYTPETLIETCLELIRRSGVSAGYLRPIAYHGYGKMGLYPKGAPLHVAISAWKWGKYLSEHPVRAKIPSVRRTHPATTTITAKISGHYANSILASNEIHQSGYDEAILLDTDGYIAEGPWENIFFVRGREVVTPALGTILPGITRASIMTLLRDRFGITVHEERLHPGDIVGCNEAFFTGTAAEVTPIGSITDESGHEHLLDSKNPLGIAQAIKTLYMGVVTGREMDYRHWLS